MMLTVGGRPVTWSRNKKRWELEAGGVRLTVSFSYRRQSYYLVWMFDATDRGLVVGFSPRLKKMFWEGENLLTTLLDDRRDDRIVEASLNSLPMDELGEIYGSALPSASTLINEDSAFRSCKYPVRQD